MKRFQKALLGVVVSGIAVLGTGGGTAQFDTGYAAIGYDGGTAGDQGLRSGENARLFTGENWQIILSNLNVKQYLPT